MINSKFLEISEELKKDYYDAIKSKSERQIFLFLRKFLKYIENDDTPFNRTFILEDPTKNKKRQEFCDDFDKKISDFLAKEVKKDDLKKESKKLKSDAFTYIGVGYEYGLFGFEENRIKAFNNYTIAAQLNNDLGTFKLAQCYENGTGARKNLEKALCFYRCAAKLGLADAMHAYGTILCNGYVGADHDQKTGFYYLKTASERSSVLCPYPLYDLGMYYSSPGETDEPRDIKYAVEVFKKGADYGDPNCQYKLAEIYEFGDMGVSKDKPKSIEYYTAAASNGHVGAQITMSQHYLQGLSNIVPKNHSQSFKWALRAASKGESNATYILGEYAETGTGNKKDILYALFWFQISENLGNKRATTKIISLNKDVARKDAGVEIPKSCCSFLCF